MITDTFEARTLANMEIALDRACAMLTSGSEDHRIRKRIASKIVARAKHGDGTLTGLTEAGMTAVHQLNVSCKRMSA